MVHGRYISRLNSRTRPKRLLLGASRTNVSSLLKCKSKKNLERRAAGGNFADTDGRCCETKFTSNLQVTVLGEVGRPTAQECLHTVSEAKITFVLLLCPRPHVSI